MSSSRRLPDAATIPVYDERQQPTQTGCSVILTEGAKNDKRSFWKQKSNTTTDCTDSTDGEKCRILSDPCHHVIRG